MPMLRGVVTNPLIIGIVLGLPVAPLGIELPQVAAQSAQYFANLTLPLALLCTGASLDFAALKGEWRNTIAASIGRLVVVPFIVTLGAALLGSGEAIHGIEIRTRDAERAPRLLPEIQRLLAETDLTVARIAEAVGLNNPSYLIRLFRERIGRSPGQYRNETRRPR